MSTYLYVMCRVFEGQSSWSHRILKAYNADAAQKQGRGRFGFQKTKDGELVVDHVVEVYAGDGK